MFSTANPHTRRVVYFFSHLAISSEVNLASALETLGTSPAEQPGSRLLPIRSRSFNSTHGTYKRQLRKERKTLSSMQC